LERPGISGVKIRDLLMQELSALGGVEGENVTARGPDIVVSAGQAQVLSVVFHELATNAVKHGALSKNDGRIDVSWENKTVAHEKIVSLSWRESGVFIESEPVRRGYGSEVLERFIPRMLGGRFERKFHSDGIECSIGFTSESVEPLKPAAMPDGGDMAR
jgi:two-component sensor histidine kinase